MVTILRILLIPLLKSGLRLRINMHPGRFFSCLYVFCNVKFSSKKEIVFFKEKPLAIILWAKLH